MVSMSDVCVFFSIFAFFHVKKSFVLSGVSDGAGLQREYHHHNYHLNEHFLHWYFINLIL